MGIFENLAMSFIFIISILMIFFVLISIGTKEKEEIKFKKGEQDE